MKKILIVSEHFYPRNIIGALRPTKIAQKLTARGYSVDVFTKYHIDKSDIAENKLCGCLYAYADYTGNTQKKVKTRKEHGRLYVFLWGIYNVLRNINEAIQMLSAFRKTLKNEDAVKNIEYDVVLSSFGPLSSLLCGMYYKKKHPEVKWICDFRDPIVTISTPAVMRPLYSYLQNTACKRADAIITVSNGAVNRVCKVKYRKKAYMIPNGYDISDAVTNENTANVSDCLSMTYTGSLYRAEDLSPVFRALRELADNAEIALSKVKVNYAGTQYTALQKQAMKYGLQDILADNGFLSRENSLKLQFSSDLLLLATWNVKNDYGVITGKFPEYMLSGKPIISVTSGELPNGEVTQIMREGKLGFAYEEACCEADFPLLKAYIKKCYDELFSVGKIAFSPNPEVLKRFDYDTIVDKFEDIING